MQGFISLLTFRRVSLEWLDLVYWCATRGEYKNMVLECSMPTRSRYKCIKSTHWHARVGALSHIVFVFKRMIYIRCQTRTQVRKTTHRLQFRWHRIEYYWIPQRTRMPSVEAEKNRPSQPPPSATSRRVAIGWSRRISQSIVACPLSVR